MKFMATYPTFFVFLILKQELMNAVEGIIECVMGKSFTLTASYHGIERKVKWSLPSVWDPHCGGNILTPEAY